MTTPSFTPGPWAFDVANIGCIYVFSDAPGHREPELAILNPENEANAANARLIAAAPELYAFIRRVTDGHDAERKDTHGTACVCPQCEEARAIIKKIEGGAS